MATKSNKAPASSHQHPNPRVPACHLTSGCSGVHTQGSRELPCKGARPPPSPGAAPQLCPRPRGCAGQAASAPGGQRPTQSKAQPSQADRPLNHWKPPPPGRGLGPNRQRDVAVRRPPLLQRCQGSGSRLISARIDRAPLARGLTRCGWRSKNGEEKSPRRGPVASRQRLFERFH